MVSTAFLTPAEVGEILKVTAQTVRAMCERGEIAHIRIGTGKRTTYRIQKRFLDQLLQKSNETNPTEETSQDQDIDLKSDEEYIQNWLKK
jgi:excisionase family DNA binding protein